MIDEELAIGIDSYDEKRFLSWLSKLMKPDRFDVVITVERKATAVVRTLLDMPIGVPCNWDWSRVLSSDAIPYLPAGTLNGKRVLVFNEMIHRGRSTKQAIQVIGENSPEALRQLHTAAFIVHEEFYKMGSWRTAHFRGDSPAESPDFALQRGVSDRLYRIIQQSLVESLRNRGALLLDTEHLETTFSHTLPHRKFLDALGTFGEPIEYAQDDENVFPGVTIRSPVVADIERVRSALPAGTDVDSQTPKKVRLVRRGTKEFAFIPIWYPPIPVGAASDMDGWNVPSYLRRSLVNCPKTQRAALTFHLSSLVAGVELIRSLWAGLAPFVGKGIEPIFLAGSEQRSSPLGHLRSLYPLLDFGELEKVINSAIRGYEDLTTSNRVHAEAGWTHSKGKPTVAKLPLVGAEERFHKCRELLVEVIRRQRRYSLGEDWFDDEDGSESSPQGYSPFTWKECWDVGEELDIPAPLRSVLMDTAIDSALLKTSHQVVSLKDEAYVVRAYAPDSEFAEQALEKLAYGAEEVLIA